MGYSNADSGFVWDERALFAVVIGLVLIAVATVLFFIFSKKHEHVTDGLTLIEVCNKYPLALVGSFFRGLNKEVGAPEYMATLMSLTHSGVLVIEYDEKGEAYALSRAPQAKSTTHNSLDDKTLKLLAHFADEEGRVTLESAKQRGEVHKEEVTADYRAWRALVQEQTKKHLADRKVSFLVQRVMQYGGYACFVLAALSAYMVSLTVTTVCIVVGAILVLLSISMQRRIFIERQNAKRLYLWLDGLETQSSELSLDAEQTRELVEYACLFTLANKVSAFLAQYVQDEESKQVIDNILFWKNLRSQLYDETQELFAKRSKQES